MKCIRCSVSRFYLNFILFCGIVFFVTACGGGDGLDTTKAEPVRDINANLSFDLKTFRFSWTDVADATYYRLLENPDGNSGFTQVGSDILQGTSAYDHPVALYDRINARYILQSCNANVCADSPTIAVSGNLEQAIGYFKADNTEASDIFGQSVSLSSDGNTLAVGAYAEDSNSTGFNSIPNDDGNANLSGAVYVFFRNGATWVQQAYLKADNTGADDRFGNSVSLSDDGNTLAVGAYAEDSNSTGFNSIPNDDGNATNSGAVYVFTRSGVTWSQQAYLKSSSPGAYDLFGISLSLSANGTTLAVGAYQEDSNTVDFNSVPNDDGNANESGAVYVFIRSGITWSQQAYLKTLNTGAGDSLGYSVSLSDDGNTLAAGAYWENGDGAGFNPTPNEGAYHSGAAYVFIRSGVTWSQQAYLKALTSEAFDVFGYSVSLSGDGNTLAVGATGEDSNSTGYNSEPNDDGSADGSGAAYVFIRSGVTWSQQAYLKAHNTGAADLFGTSIGLSTDGNTLAVGARWEQSSSTGVNSISNNGASSTGAAYVFKRNGVEWSQQAYLKAPNTGNADNFGEAICVSGDGRSLVVGARLEDSNSTGVGSIPNDDGNANDSGAVYLY